MSMSTAQAPICIQSIMIAKGWFWRPAVNEVQRRGNQLVCEERMGLHLGLLQCLAALGVMGDCGELLKFWPPHPTACLSCASACQELDWRYGPLQDGSYAPQDALKSLRS